MITVPEFCHDKHASNQPQEAQEKELIIFLVTNPKKHGNHDDKVAKQNLSRARAAA